VFEPIRKPSVKLDKKQSTHPADKSLAQRARARPYFHHEIVWTRVQLIHNPPGRIRVGKEILAQFLGRNYPRLLKGLPDIIPGHREIMKEPFRWGKKREPGDQALATCHSLG